LLVLAAGAGAAGLAGECTKGIQPLDGAAGSRTSSVLARNGGLPAAAPRCHWIWIYSHCEFNLLGEHRCAL
jgi:hypothetical protein